MQALGPCSLWQTPRARLPRLELIGVDQGKNRVSGGVPDEVRLPVMGRNPDGAGPAVGPDGGVRIERGLDEAAGICNDASGDPGQVQPARRVCVPDGQRQRAGVSRLSPRSRSRHTRRCGPCRPAPIPCRDHPRRHTQPSGLRMSISQAVQASSSVTRLRKARRLSGYWGIRDIRGYGTNRENVSRPAPGDQPPHGAACRQDRTGDGIDIWFAIRLQQALVERTLRPQDRCPARRARARPAAAGRDAECHPCRC